MTALDMTADAEQYREIAREFTDGGPCLLAYAEDGVLSTGLPNEVRKMMRTIEGLHFRRARPEHFSQTYRLGKLLGHVAPLLDQLNADRACEKSPTGWHEWANNEQCCHCGKEVP